MHILLTDQLTCPRCGPRFGLILLADRIEDRRVLEGGLGCSNCRETYPIRDGFADLRVRPVPPLEAPDPAPEAGGREEAFRLAALLGVAEGGGFALLVGADARVAPGIADLVDGLEVVAAGAEFVGWPERSGVSRLAIGGALPFTNGGMRAVALTGASGTGALVEEALRVVSPVGRVVVDDPPEDIDERVDRAGLVVVARDAQTVVIGRG